MQPSGTWTTGSTDLAIGNTTVKVTRTIGNICGLNSQMADFSIANAKMGVFNSIEHAPFDAQFYSAYCDNILKFPDSGNYNYYALRTHADTAETRRSCNFFPVFAVPPSNDMTAYFWGYEPLKTATYSNKNGENTQLVVNLKYKHILYSMQSNNLKGFLKSDLDAWQADKNAGVPTASNISFSDFIANPSNYVITEMRIGGAHLWDGEQWTSTSQIIPMVLVNGGKSQGLCRIDYNQGFNYQCRQQYNARSNSNHMGAGGGSRNAYAIPVELRNGDPIFMPNFGGGGNVLFDVPFNTRGDLLAAVVSEWTEGWTGTHAFSHEHKYFTWNGMYILDEIRYSANKPSNADFTNPDYIHYVTMAYRGEYISAALASLGMYFTTEWDNDWNTTDPDIVVRKTTTYLGAMDRSGTTTGLWIRGDGLDEYEGYNKDGSSVNPYFDPTGGGGGGGGGGDELVDMPSRAQFHGSGLTKYYVNVPASKLQTALGNWDNIETGKDVLQNLLSYKIMCFPSTMFTNGMSEPFVIAGVELHDELDNVITAPKVTNVGAVNLPSIVIPSTFGDFRDYAPYTKLQMFVPLCGWFDLPPWCMGRTISGEMYIEPYNGTVRCIVRADGNVVAELGGNASIDLPFNAEAVGMKSAAVLSNIINTAKSVGNALTMPSMGNIAGVGSAALGLTCAMNANYTESKGTMGDGSNVYGLYHVYVKITRPATIDKNGNDIKTIPSQYKHDFGLPCAKQLTLAAGDGYTQVLDANITGNMTAAEKQMIIDGFRHGLIISANAT